MATYLEHKIPGTANTTDATVTTCGSYTGETRVELTGTPKTQAQNLLTSLKNLVLAAEGL